MSSNRLGTSETHPPQQQPRTARWAPYLVTALLMAILTAINVLLESVFPGVYFRIPYLLVTGLAGYLYGAGPALLAFMLGILGFDLVYGGPKFSLWPIAVGPNDWAQLIVFVIGSLIAGIAMSGLHDARIALAQRTARLEDEVEERRRTEQALRESEARYRSLYENVPVGIVVGNTQGEILAMNSVALDLHGFESEEDMFTALSQYAQVFELRYPDGRILPLEEWPASKAMRGELVRDYDVLLRNLVKGGERVVAYNTSAVQAGDGGATLVVYVIQDITERTRAEESVRQQTEKLQEQAQIVDLAPIFIRDLDGKITLWTTGDEEMYGYTREAALGRVSHELLCTVFPEPLSDIDAKVLREGHWEGNLVHTRKDGCEITAASRWAIYYDIRGNPVAMLEANTDITELKRVQNELQRLTETLEQRVAQRTEQLEAASKEMEAFTYSVSHDLRAPLRLIDGFSLALLEDYGNKVDEEGKSYLHFVRDSAQRMGQLIDDLLRLSRIGRAEMHFEKVDLSGLAESVIAEFRQREPGRQVNVTIEPGLTVCGDTELLRVSLENLLGNAWKYTSRTPSARIEFGATQQDGERVYFVRDNGAGFDMAYADKLFSPFQRLHTEAEFPGTGIGLSIVRRIISRHGGRIWATGEVDRGATFCFTVPTEGKCE